MKKQLAIAIVAIMLTAVLLVPPVMAFALWDVNSVQYSSHWSEGYNSITDKSVTASNQSIAIGNGIGERESSSRLKYYRAPVPVRTSNWSAIVMGTGIRDVRSISWNSADGIRMNISENFTNEIKEMNRDIVIGEAPTPIKVNMSDILKNGTRLIDESDGSVLKGKAPRCLRRNVKVDARDLLNGTKTLLP
ncbi:hypothetical protein C5S32_10825 [ANME-1 cluster archaeon GoMg1]|nr:hypothetical protein [ANME-1 cluster archaeon GoMg1]